MHTGDFGPIFLRLRPEWVSEGRRPSEDVHPLDAPDMLPAGSREQHECGGYLYAGRSVAWRPGE
jgi:hypothetical protein